MVEAIEQFEKELTDVNDQLKKTPSHLKWDELPETEQFERLAPSRKQLVDTVKMIAYRAETAMASIVRESLARTDDGRSLLRDFFRSEADLFPDAGASTSTCAGSSDVESAFQQSNRPLCWNISTRPSSRIRARICGSSTRLQAEPKSRRRPHIKIPQIRRSEAVCEICVPARNFGARETGQNPQITSKKSLTALGDPREISDHRETRARPPRRYLTPRENPDDSRQ